MQTTGQFYHNVPSWIELPQLTSVDITVYTNYYKCINEAVSEKTDKLCLRCVYPPLHPSV